MARRWESLDGIELAGVGVEVGEVGGELMLDIGVLVEGTEMGGGGGEEAGAGMLEEVGWTTGGDSGVK